MACACTRTSHRPRPAMVATPTPLSFASLHPTLAPDLTACPSSSDTPAAAVLAAALSFGSDEGKSGDDDATVWSRQLLLWLSVPTLMRAKVEMTTQLFGLGSCSMLLCRGSALTRR
jgi:hypothetical protein